MPSTSKGIKILNRSSSVETGNITRMGTVTRASGYTDGTGFFIKIETTAGNLKVILLNDSTQTPILTAFQLGWNPELVSAIVADEVNNTAVDISWGK
jgi:hypothetical protein